MCGMCSTFGMARVLRYVGNRETPEKELYGPREQLHWPKNIYSSPSEGLFARVPDILTAGFEKMESGIFAKPQMESIFPNLTYLSFANNYIYGTWAGLDRETAVMKEEEAFEVNMMEALVGWKAWSVEDGVLRSAQQAEVTWPADQPLVARCSTGCTEAPREHHTCGIYAGEDRDEAQRYANEPEDLIGLCYGWGRYVRGGNGWRSQFAYPKCFYLKQHQAELIEPLKTYHVPVYIEQPSLIYNPEEDGYEYRGAEADGDCRAYQDATAAKEGSSGDEEDS